MGPRSVGACSARLDQFFAHPISRQENNLEVDELRDNLFESNKIFEALWPAFGNQDKSVLSQFKNLLGLVAEQIADQNVPSATSPLMLTFKSA